MKTIITVPETMDRRKKSWRKLLEAVDKSQTNGYAFVGEWLKSGERAELDVGSYILCYDEPGSMKNWYPCVRLIRVAHEGEAQQILEWKGGYCERSWALAVRDKIATILAEAAGPIELSVEEQALVEQLKALTPDRLEAVLAAIK